VQFKHTRECKRNRKNSNSLVNPSTTDEKYKITKLMTIYLNKASYIAK
jgi:hypothetical protein